MTERGETRRAGLGGIDLAEHFAPVSVDEWRALAERSLKGRPLESLARKTLDGVTIRPVYTAEDAPPDQGYPGGWPHLRGGRHLGNAVSGWEACQDMAVADPGEAAVRVAAGRARGLGSVLVSLDCAVRTGSAAEEAGQ